MTLDQAKAVVAERIALAKVEAAACREYAENYRYAANRTDDAALRATSFESAATAAAQARSIDRGIEAFELLLQHVKS